MMQVCADQVRIRQRRQGNLVKVIYIKSLVFLVASGASLSDY